MEADEHHYTTSYRPSAYSSPLLPNTPRSHSITTTLIQLWTFTAATTARVSGRLALRLPYRTPESPPPPASQGEIWEHLSPTPPRITRPFAHTFTHLGGRHGAAVRVRSLWGTTHAPNVCFVGPSGEDEPTRILLQWRAQRCWRLWAGRQQIRLQYTAGQI